MLIVGLTGGIASGKSTVSGRLSKEHKLTIVDADLIAREVVEPGTAGYNKVISAFLEAVPDLVNEDKTLNRAALGRAVFGNKERLSKLNSIVHPAVRKEIAKQILGAYLRFESLVILDIPLLFESGLNKICGVTLTVTCSDELQIERLLKRNAELTKEDAEKRISSQMNNDQRNHKADLVIDNNKDLKDLEEAVDSVVKQIRPWWIWTVLDYFPPFGLISALLTLTVHLVKDKLKGVGPERKSD